MDKIKGVGQNVPSLPNDYEVPEVWSPPESTGGTFGSINQPTAGARTEEELPRGKHDLQLYSLGTPNGIKVNKYFQNWQLDHLVDSIKWLFELK